MEEQRLAGGNTWGEVRIAQAVHRPTQPWTPAGHAVLRHLDAVGFDGAPRVLGFDERYVALLPGAADLEQAAREVEALPASFWLRPGRSRNGRGPV